MIRLDRFDPKIIEEHLKAFRKKTLDKLKLEFFALPDSVMGPRMAPAIFAYLEQNIDSILSGEPKALRSHIRYFEKKHQWFHKYAKRAPNAKQGKNTTYESIVNAVYKSFSYDSFSKARKDKWGAYQLVKAYGHRLCPYCHLNHLNYHFEPASAGIQEFNLRPPLDHYYPRGYYPYLGVSLYNLIPSCHQCNSSVKLQKDPLSHFLPNPFYFPKDGLRFSLKNIPDYRKKVNAVDIEVLISCKRKPVQNHVEFFALKKRYSWYTLEVEDMHDRYLSYIRNTNVLAPAVAETIVLGFDKNERTRRAMGICLSDICNELLELKSFLSR